MNHEPHCLHFFHHGAYIFNLNVPRILDNNVQQDRGRNEYVLITNFSLDFPFPCDICINIARSPALGAYSFNWPLLWRYRFRPNFHFTQNFQFCVFWLLRSLYGEWLMQCFPFWVKSLHRNNRWLTHVNHFSKTLL